MRKLIRGVLLLTIVAGGLASARRAGLVEEH